MNKYRKRTHSTLVSLQAIVFAGTLVAQAPPAREAAMTAIAQHVAQGRIDLALAAYDSYVKRVKRNDAGLLEPVAREELRAAARRYAADAILHAAALERLARAGDRDALQALKQSIGSHPAPLVSLARLEVRDAPARLGALLAGASANAKLEIIDAIADAGARSEAPKVAALINDADPQVRAGAARALGMLGYRDAIPQLKVLFERDPTLVRSFAAVALKRLGDPSADAFVAQMLASESPDVRLMAVAAYPPSPRAPWVERVKALRNDPNDLARVRAADALACCDPDAARAMLVEALSNRDPSLRVEAARVMESRGLADMHIARRLLEDQFAQVRLYGAGAVLKLAAAAR